MIYSNAMRRAYFLSCLSWTLAACQHSQPAKDKPGVTADAGDKVEAESDPAQMELWSPAKRKANASFYYLSGEYETLARNPTKAKRFFENAYNLDPNPFLAVKIIEIKASEDIEQAIVLAQKMILLYPNHGELQLLYGRLLSAVGNFDEAEKHLQAAIRIDPQSLESYMFLMQLYQAQKKYEAAIPVASNMVKVNSSIAEGWARLAKLYMFTKKFKLALEPARRAYDINTNDPENVHLYAVVLERNGEKQKAAAQYDAILRLDPTNDDLIARMVGLYKQLGTLDEALKNLDLTEKAAGRSIAGIRLQKVLIYWDQQEFAKASELLDQLAIDSPQSERITYMAALGQERTKQLEKAIATYSSFDPSSEFYPVARYRAIDILRRQGSIDAAFTLVKEVLNSQTDRAADFYPLGAQILSAQKKYLEAAQLMEEGLKRFPERLDLLFLRAVNIERGGRFDEAVSLLQQLLTKDPSHAAAHNYLGYMYAERRVHLDQALTHIQKALELKPDDGYYLDSLGWVYFQLGDFQKALEVLSKANEQAANEAVILEHIGDTYGALGQPTKASEYYDKAMRTKQDEADLQRIKAKADKIKKD